MSTEVETSLNISETARDFLDFARNDKELESFRMPIRIFQAAFAFVFEKFVNRCEQDARPFRVDAHIKVEFVVHEINVAMAAHGKKSSSDFEILSVNDPFLDGEISARIPRDAVACARNNQI